VKKTDLKLELKYQKILIMSIKKQVDAERIPVVEIETAGAPKSPQPSAQQSTCAAQQRIAKERTALP